VAGCCECGDEPSGSCATELVSFGTLGPLQCDDLVINIGRQITEQNVNISYPGTTRCIPHVIAASQYGE
jgi:hypothetical protein